MRRKRLEPVIATVGNEVESGPAAETKSTWGKFPEGVARYGRGAAGPGFAPVASVASDAALAAALEEVSNTLVAARTEGRLVQRLPLEAISEDHLMRDRLPVWDAAMEALKESLRLRGQQSPIEVVFLGEGRWGLISGWRRLSALRRLAEEAPGSIDGILALERQPADAAEAYQAMVEENEVRVDLSHYERARIAVKAVDQGVFPTEKAALLTLFRSASRPRRSKIRAFIPLVREFDASLRFPARIGERLGLRLARGLAAEGGLAGRLRLALETAGAATPEAEQAVLEAALKPARAAGNKAVRSGAAPSGAEVRPGLRLAETAEGLVLSGPGVDAAFKVRLETWLRNEG